MRVELQDIYKTYRDSHGQPVHALQGVDLQVNAAEFVAISGSSGCGKSTLLNVIGCLDRPTKGAYILDGQDVSQLSKDERADIRNRKLGFIFQGFNLLSRTSAIENVELPMLYAGLPVEERQRRAMEGIKVKHE